MEPWDVESQLLEPQTITSAITTRLTTPSADYSGFLPFSDEFYWENQCDKALSEEAAKSHCDDDDFDEIVNVEPFDGPTSSPAEVPTTASIPNTVSQVPRAELSDSRDQTEASCIMATSPQDDPMTTRSLTDSLLADSHKHYKPISVGYTLFGGSSNLSTAPENLVSSSSPSPAINGIPMYRTPISRTYHNLGHSTDGVPAGVAGGDVVYDKLDKHREHGYSSSTDFKYEIGIRNINKTYLNRLNVVLSLMLVICSIIGIALFLFYMLSCNE